MKRRSCLTKDELHKHSMKIACKTPCSRCSTGDFLCNMTLSETATFFNLNWLYAYLENQKKKGLLLAHGSIIYFCFITYFFTTGAN